MNFTDRELEIIRAALSYMGSNLDDVNECYDEDEVKHFVENEVSTLVAKIVNIIPQTGPYHFTDEDGTQAWYLNGERHRVDGPAVVRQDGSQAWWLNGKNHREDGPAVIEPNGYQEWWQNGQLHRTNGPAVICPSGTQAWYCNGKRHRVDGPARIWADGTQEWWLNGERQPVPPA